MSLSLSGKRWLHKPFDPRQAQELALKLGVHPVVGALLYSRGLGDERRARCFLTPQLSELSEPQTLPGLGRAAALLAAAIESQRSICVYGDYDVDGLTATALVLRFLELVECPHSYYIPNRLDEGYGLSNNGVASAHNKGAEVLLTVDCGIAAHSEVELARSLGLTVVVSDHHEPGGTLPAADALVNPKALPEGHPARDLAGVGVAFQLMRGVAAELGTTYQKKLRNAGWPRCCLDLVATGTVADVVPLTGDNRILVSLGLRELRHSPSTGLAALCQTAGAEVSELSARQVAFVIAPRLNAAGRMGTAEAALGLLVSGDAQMALEVAQELDSENRRRQAVERRILAEAEKALLEQCDPEEDRVLVVAKEGWHQGVIGIVASRLAERYYRPAVVIALEGDGGKGSGRSIEGFHLQRAFRACGDLLERCGGHAMAAGLTIAADKVDRFREEINRYADRMIDDEVLTPKLHFDCPLPLGQLNEELLEQLAMLAPHGEGNPSPVFLCAPLRLQSQRVVGRDGTHLQLELEDVGGNLWRAIGFGLGSLAGSLPGPGEMLEVLTTPFIDEWEGRRSLRMRLFDIRPRPRRKAPGGPAHLIVREAAGGLPVRTTADQVMEGLLRQSNLRILCQETLENKLQALLKLVKYFPLVAVRDERTASRLYDLLASQALLVPSTGPRLVDEDRQGEVLSKECSVPVFCLLGGVEPDVLAGCLQRVHRQLVIWDMPYSARTADWLLQLSRLLEPRPVYLLSCIDEPLRFRQEMHLSVPDDDELRMIYKALRILCGTGTSTTIDHQAVVRFVSRSWERKVSPAAVRLAVRVFEELGLLRRQGDQYVLVEMPGAVDLHDSLSYNVGKRLVKELGGIVPLLQRVLGERVPVAVEDFPAC